MTTPFDRSHQRAPDHRLAATSSLTAVLDVRTIGAAGVICAAMLKAAEVGWFTA